ncbi:MAG: phosphoribosylformylglycinamidine synthase subunit PurQ, partial [Lachnospiraceae bacterium]|nr:phosphoribosylformylglycinamidine synthase subunit PurQ [Lachnospiraceae bacterium]
LDIDLDRVPKKYEGLDGTELAISESQERMAVVVAEKDKDAFLALAARENLSAVQVAVVTEEPRLRMHWNGKTIVDVSRAFLNSNGAEKEAEALVKAPRFAEEPAVRKDFAETLKDAAASLRSCSRRGLSERFDSTIGAGTVLMPFGGKNQLTPVQAMVHKLPVLNGETTTCSVMSYGFDPVLSGKSPYHGAYNAVVESAAKLIAAGASRDETYLTFQEYFERLGSRPERWGKPLAALLGALKAQLDLNIGAIGGKDSMSGSFEDLDVPPTLVSFAVTAEKLDNIVTPELKAAGNRLFLVLPKTGEDGLPQAEDLMKKWDAVTALMRCGTVVSAYVPGAEGAAVAAMKMAMGNGLGVAFEEEASEDLLFGAHYGALLVETAKGAVLPEELGAVPAGTVTKKAALELGGKLVSVKKLLGIYEERLEAVYPCNDAEADETAARTELLEELEKTVQQREAKAEKGIAPAAHYTAAVHTGIVRPRFLIPVFPGTNCEYDSARAVEAAGGEAEIFVIRNRSAEEIAFSVSRFADELKKANVVFVPGGFSGGDEPDGSGKFITAFFRNAAVKDGVGALMEQRGGLMLGICNGFQALIKLGLLPYGRITEPDENAPTLTFNVIGRHQSRLVQTRIASTLSPWLSLRNP